MSIASSNSAAPASFSAQAHRLGHVARLRRHGQHQRTHLRFAFFKLVQHLEARAFAQAEIQQHHLRLLLLRLDNGLRGITAFTDHLVARGVQQGMQPVAQDDLVIHEVHPCHAAVPAATRPKLSAVGVVGIKLPG